MKKWTDTDTTQAKYLGIIEFQYPQGEFHTFEVLETADKLVFGGSCNVGFLESGYINKEGFSTAQILVELQEDLEIYYSQGKESTNMIVFNERM